MQAEFSASFEHRQGGRILRAEYTERLGTERLVLSVETPVGREIEVYTGRDIWELPQLLRARKKALADAREGK